MLKAPHLSGLHAVLLSPEGGDGAGDGAGGAGSSVEPAAPAAPESPPPAGGDGNTGADATVSKAEYEAAKAELQKLQAFADRMKEAEKTERQKRQAAQEEQGQFKALSEELRTERDEYRAQLEALQKRVDELAPAAERLKATEDSLRSKVDERLANGLPDYLKTALRGMQDVNAQWEAIQLYDRERGTPPPTKPSTQPGGPPPPAGSGQVLTPGAIAERVRAGETMEAIKATPEYQAMIASGAGTASGSPAPKAGMFSRLWSGGAGTRKG